MPSVELIYDVDCPNVQRSREALLEGFRLARLEPSWTEWDRNSPESPAYASTYGSPTILVDGRDVAGITPGNGRSSCRLYDNPGGSFDSAPSAQQIEAALRVSKAKHPR